ncbi:hypothetical protein SAMN05192538_2183 [Bacillus velezensis]|nr:hypothetical protein KOF112_37490 [Bacillus velezensis]SDJ81173.1 hypothetical protein SAMN05192538_2183 [Bacillus velezensis]
MKRFILVIPLLAAVIASPTQMKASPMPCSAVLEPVNQKLKNAKGAALIYKVQLYPPSAARTNMSILAVHLPQPSSYGSYDGYEGLPPKQGKSVGDLNYIRLPRERVLIGLEGLIPYQLK